MKFKTNNEKLLNAAKKKMERKRLNNLQRKGVNPDTKRPSNLHELVKNISNREIDDYNNEIPDKVQYLNVCKENSARLFGHEVQKVIEQSDVIIQVIDARDPIGSRSKEIESQILSRGSSKRLVILMNKIDLVPPHIIKDWVKHMRRQLPTIPFKASTQDQSKKLGRFDDFYSLGDNELKQSKCSGADLLLSLLANYCRCKDIKTKITVGVIGFPNTGKSSVINSLKRKRVCNIGPIPGVTRSLQTVQLTKFIQLIDSPGIILKSDQDNPLKAILANCVCPQQIKDPIAIAEEIFRLVPHEEIYRVYGIGDVSDVDNFLTEFAVKKGQMKRGGVPNMEEAALALLKDWNEGKIIHYVPVPNNFTAEDLSHVDARIVSEMSAEFDIDALCCLENVDCESMDLD